MAEERIAIIDGCLYNEETGEACISAKFGQKIVRCKDCKYYEIAWLKKDGTDDKRYKPSICVRGQYGITREPDWFCADAERREE